VSDNVGTEYGRQAQARTLPHATRDGEHWTDEDVAAAHDLSLTNLDLALKLRRSFWAVHEKRTRLGIKTYERTGERGRPARTDSPFDLQSTEKVCPDCFTICASSGACLC
jgi:hypothetical protein